MTIIKPIDLKHSIRVELLVGEEPSLGDITIIKTSNNQPISENEPVILFRGRDRLALPMLMHYRQLCIDDQCTPYQLQSIDEMIARFRQFSLSSPAMKQPGITEGR